MRSTINPHCGLVGLLSISVAFSPQVIFTSLDLVLHTEALLSAVNFLSAALSSHDVSLPEKETRTKTEHKTVSSKSGQCNMHTLTEKNTHTHIRTAGCFTLTMSLLSAALPPPGDSDVIELKVMMMLEAFNVLVCDQSCSTADIKVQGRKKCPSPCSSLLLLHLWRRCSLTFCVFVPCRSERLAVDARSPDSHLRCPQGCGRP